MFAVGIYVMSIGFGWLPAPAKATTADEWKSRYSRFFRIGGVLLVVISVLLILGEYARSTRGAG
jgi:hypothetical protein